MLIHRLPSSASASFPFQHTDGGLNGSSQIPSHHAEIREADFGRPDDRRTAEIAPFEIGVVARDSEEMILAAELSEDGEQLKMALNEGAIADPDWEAQRGHIALAVKLGEGRGGTLLGENPADLHQCSLGCSLCRVAENGHRSSSLLALGSNTTHLRRHPLHCRGVGVPRVR